MTRESLEFHSYRIWSRWETKLWTFTFFMGTCVIYASRVALPIAAVTIAQEYGWNKADSGTVMSCFFWGYAFTQVIAGAIADLIGGERVLQFTTGIWALLTLFTPQLFDFAYWSGYPLVVLLFVRIFTGVGQGFHLPSMASIVSRHLVAADKGRVFGICLAGSHLGTTIAGGVGSVFLELFGWRSVFQFVGLISILWWCLFIRLKTQSSTRTAPHIKLPIDDAHSDENHLLEIGDKATKRGPPAPVPWSSLFSNIAFWAAAAAQYVGANAYFTMFSWLPSYFSDNFPRAKAVIYNVVPSLAIVTTSIIAPFVASRLLARGKSVTYTRRLMEALSLLGMAASLLLVSISAQFYSSLTLFTIAMAARGFHHGGVSVNPHDFAPNHTGSVFGIFNSFSAITGFIGVYLAGAILTMTNNNWSAVFCITALQCIAGALFYACKGTGNKII